MLGFEIPNYTLHPLNHDKDVGRSIVLYSHASIDRSVIQVKLEVNFDEVSMLEIRLRGGYFLLLGCCYRSPTKTEVSATNNSNLNKLVNWISEQKHSHKCIMGDFDYKQVNWHSWSTSMGEKLSVIRFSINTWRSRPNDVGTTEHSILDLVSTNGPMQVSNLCHVSQLGTSPNRKSFTNMRKQITTQCETKPQVLHRSASFGQFL